MKIKSIKSLNSVRELYQKSIIERQKECNSVKKQILICFGGGCLASGSEKIYNEFKRLLKEKNINNKVELVQTGCMGPCSDGPVIKIIPDNLLYCKINEEDVKTILEQHLILNKPVVNLLKKNPDEKRIVTLKNLSFFTKQHKVALRNCGLIDPCNINEYIALGGYKALYKALKIPSVSIIDEVINSGLRGRGGGGFSTGLKWKFAHEAKGKVKNVICNADEGDPGAFMDRSIIEGDPHTLIEGMIIAGYTVGASNGYVYCRAEYPLAIERLNLALQQARDYGLLGSSIFNTEFSFDIEIRIGAGAFVCGEETALIASIEGYRGIPRTRPPFPAVKGLWNCPTLINNVETYANITNIVTNGASSFAKLGTEKSKGTKVFALAGSVKNSGLVEVPIGLQLGELIFDIGGGMLNDRNFKAAQLGGPSGGCIPKHHLDVKVDYESLSELGAIMGSGGLIIMDEKTCMVDMARFFLEFTQEESCGKCTPCRVGTKNMLDILDNICQGKGKPGDIERLEELGEIIKKTALCGLGQTAPNPVLSTIRHFRDEYEEHIIEKKCRAGICAGLVDAPCNSGCPAEVNIPGFVSLSGEGRFDEALELHRERNPLAAICARVCFHPCESLCMRSMIDSPVSIRGIKRYMTDNASNKKILPKVLLNIENAQKKIAIIGSGPSGLSCTYFLARLGYRPNIFESSTKVGGMLSQTIPAYRLPRDIIKLEVEMIKELGVEIKTNQTLGKDYTLQNLKDNGYEAVYLAVGAPTGWTLGIPGERAEGITDAISFLKEFNENGETEVGRNVVVIGGGNAAMDAARTAIRLGAESVKIVYRRTKESMPAFYEEIEETENEGIEIYPLLKPLEVISKNNKVTGIKCQKMKLGCYDKSGRRRPVNSELKPVIIPTDKIIAAIGQELDTSALLNGIDLNIKKNGFIDSDKINCQTSIPWIFAGGDCVTGPSSVIEAVAQGEKAAIGISQYLNSKEKPFWRDFKASDTKFDPDADPVPFQKVNCLLIPVAERKNNFNEIEQTFDSNTLIKQAKRCLRCDYEK